MGPQADWKRGEPQAARQLEAAAAQPTHAYLFAGPPGTFKRRAALDFALALTCERGHALGGCGACPTCEAVAAERHPDVRFWELAAADKTFKVERVRELLAEAGVKPHSAGRRVFVLGAADALAPAGANALLKTLEEPPAALVLILLSAEPDALLPTIRSRCQSVGFGRMEPGALAAWLTEATGLDPAFAARAAFEAEGAPRLAFEHASGVPEPFPGWPPARPAGRMAWAERWAQADDAARQAAFSAWLAVARDALVGAALPDGPFRRPDAAPWRAELAARGPAAARRVAEAVEAARQDLAEAHMGARGVFDRLGDALAAAGAAESGPEGVR